MIVVGLVTLFALAPLPLTAIIISLCGFVISAYGLWQHRDCVAWPCLWPMMLWQAPGIWIGVELLLYLASHHLQLLEIIAGALIVVTAANQLIKARSETVESGVAAYSAAGFFSGLMTGLFSAGGAPLVYLFYRQPWSVRQIKACLFAIFTVSTSIRIAVVGAQGDLTREVLWISAVALPVVYFASYLANRFPPPGSSDIKKQCALVLFGVMGVSLMAAGLV